MIIIIFLCACLSPHLEPAAASGLAGPADQHPAAAGGDPSGAELWDVHHGGAHVLPHVLQLPLPGRAAHEAE